MVIVVFSHCSGLLNTFNEHSFCLPGQNSSRMFKCSIFGKIFSNSGVAGSLVLFIYFFNLSV